MGDSRDVLSRPAPPPDFTVRYGDHRDQIADVRLPSAASPAGRPIVYFFHGGFWRQEYDRTHTGPLATALAEAGHVVITAEYRRTGGDGGWTSTWDDVAAGLATVPALVRERLTGRSVPTPAGLVLGGHSAGGHLALWAAANRSTVAVAIDGVVALAPVADLRLAYDLDLDHGAVRALLGGGPDEVPERYAAADPRSRLPLGVPVRIVHGRNDLQVPVRLSTGYAAAARAAGDEVDLDQPDADHFAVIDPESKVWPRIVAAFGRRWTAS